MNTPQPSPAIERDSSTGVRDTSTSLEVSASPPRLAIHLRFDAWLKSLTDEERLAYSRIRIKTETDMRRDMGIDPTLPGFVGMLNSRAREAFHKRHAAPGPGHDAYIANQPTSLQAPELGPTQHTCPQNTLFD